MDCSAARLCSYCGHGRDQRQDAPKLHRNFYVPRRRRPSGDVKTVALIQMLDTDQNRAKAIGLKDRLGLSGCIVVVMVLVKPRMLPPTINYRTDFRNSATKPTVRAVTRSARMTIRICGTACNRVAPSETKLNDRSAPKPARLLDARAP